MTALRKDPVYKAVEDARRAAARHSQGPYTLAMPDSMPPDAYLATHQQNSHAAEALFWANSCLWLFAGGRT